MSDLPTLDRQVAGAMYVLLEERGADAPRVDGWTIVGTSHSRRSRWHERYWLVVRDRDGDLYGIEYGIGLTECQEHDFPWAYLYGEPLPLQRLYPHVITRVEYRDTPPT